MRGQTTPGTLNAACILLAIVLIPMPSVRAGDVKGPIKVFILAGQSNMEGKARNALLDYQADDAKTKDFYAHLRKDGKWIVRGDVFIKFLRRCNKII